MFSAGQFVQIATPSGVKFRSSPMIDAANEIGVIPNGAVLAVVGDSESGWTHVNWGAVMGYVSEQFVQGVQPTQIPSGTYELTGSGVNLRTDPSLGAKVIETTGAVGENIEVVGIAINQYAAVAYKGVPGWISTAYIKQPGAQSSIARTLPNQPPPLQPGPLTAPSSSTLAQPAAHTSTSSAPSGTVLAGGLLALALVIYFMAK